MATTPPCDEIVRYLAAHRDQTDQVMATLSYVDGAHLARRATGPGPLLGRPHGPDVPAVDPLRGIQRLGRPKEIVEYPYNAHEGGGPFQVAAQLAWLPTRVPPNPV